MNITPNFSDGDDDILDCTVTLLRLQDAHQSQRDVEKSA